MGQTITSATLPEMDIVRDYTKSSIDYRIHGILDELTHREHERRTKTNEKSINKNLATLYEHHFTQAYNNPDTANLYNFNSYANQLEISVSRIQAPVTRLDSSTRIGMDKLLLGLIRIMKPGKGEICTLNDINTTLGKYRELKAYVKSTISNDTINARKYKEDKSLGKTIDRLSDVISKLERCLK